MLNQVHMVMTDKNRKGKEIPIPQVRVVPTYNQDYLPVYERPTTYVREKGTRMLLEAGAPWLTEWEICCALKMRFADALCLVEDGLI